MQEGFSALEPNSSACRALTTQEGLSTQEPSSSVRAGSPIAQPAELSQLKRVLAPRSLVAQSAEHNYYRKTSWLENQVSQIDETGKKAKKLIDESWYINK